MTRILYTPTFVRQYQKLPAGLREEVDEKIAMFEKDPRQPSLKLHKLKGKLKGYSGFSVNYAYLIIVEEDKKDTFALLAIGDHDIYK